MRHLGFDGRMVTTIMSCIKSVSYAVLLNGEPIGNVKPTRGLRQSNPLSPYLFLLCVIGLQGLLHTAKSKGSIRGVSICRNGPRVSHLFFAVDSVLFCRAKKVECQVILDILVVYERGFGQKNLFFSSNTDPGLQTCIE